MNSRLIFVIQLLTLLGFFIAIFIISLIYLSNRVLIINQGDYNVRIPITKESAVQEILDYPGENLYLLFINLSNPNYQNKDKFIFSLYIDNNKKVEIPFSGQNIGDNDWVKFQFPQLNINQEQRITIRIDSETISPKEAVLLGRNIDEKLAIKIYAKSSLGEVLISGIKDFIERFSKDSIFSVVYLITIFSIIFLVVKIKYKHD